MTGTRPDENDPRSDTELWESVERIPVPPLSDRFLADLEARLRQTAPEQAPAAGRRPRRTALLAAVVAVVAFSGALVAVLLVGLPGSPTSSPQVANAGELAVLMSRAWTQATTLQATVVVHEYSGGTTPVTSKEEGAFIVTAGGDYRIEERSTTRVPKGATPAVDDGDQVRIYNAKTNTWLSREVNRLPTSHGPGYTVLGSYWSGTGPCPLVVDMEGMIPDAGFVRAALAETDPTVPVEKTLWQGRPAWRVKFSRINSDGSRTDWDAVVDAASGFPLHADTEFHQGSRLLASERWDLTDLRIDQKIPADTFSTRHARGMHVPASVTTPAPKHFYGACRLDQLARYAGYRPPLPTAVPTGYRLTKAAADPLSCAWYGHVRDRAGRPMVWFNQLWGYATPAGSTRPRTEVGLTYARGLGRIWIQMAPASGPGSVSAALLREELGPDWGFDVIRREKLHNGVFSGRTATTWLDGSGAGLLVADKRVVVYIGGDLTRAEALAVAASLRR